MEYVLYSKLVHVAIFGFIAWSSWGQSGGDMAMQAMHMISIPISLGVFYLFTSEEIFFSRVLPGFLIAQVVNYIIFKWLWRVYLKQYDKRLKKYEEERQSKPPVT